MKTSHAPEDCCPLGRPVARQLRRENASVAAKGLICALDLRNSRALRSAASRPDRDVRLGTRTLDILHVASASILEADAFHSFDRNQKRLARIEGLRTP